MARCLPLVKILLLIFTTIFLVFGIAVLVVGIWIKTNPEISNLGQAVKVGDTEPVIEIITWLFIGSGIFVFAVGVVGFIGTIRGSKIMLGFYMVCIFIVFAAEASAGVYSGIRKEYVIEMVEDEGAKYLKTNYSTDPQALISQGFNYVQVEHKCCGVNNFMDYQGSNYLAKLEDKIKPNASMSYACCEVATSLSEAIKGNGRLTVDAMSRDACMNEAVIATSVYTNTAERGEEARDEAYKKECGKFKHFHCSKGCSESLQDWVADNLIIFVGVGVGVGVAQLILLFLSLWYCQSVNKERDEK